MITLKSKIIRNFVAGILACVLVFSILVTIFVTFNYRQMLMEMKDVRVTEVSTWFIKYQKDPNTSIEEMWQGLDNLAKDLEVDINFEEPDGTISYEVFGRNPSNTYPIKREHLKLFNADKAKRSGTLNITYNVNPEPIEDLQRNFTSAIIYGLVISLIIGFVISLILSENISEPIMLISDDTLKIKDGKYEVTDRNTDIIEIENLQDNITYLSNNLKNQENIRKQYAQDISHELRTPLTNLQLYIEAIKDGIVEADSQTMDILLEDVIRLQDLIVGLKKTFDENVEFIQVKNEDTNITNLIKRISYSFKPKAEQNNIKISENLAENVIMNTDKNKFTQILNNLISNAMKAIGQNGNIDIYLTEDFNKIEIKVIDNGIGIAEDQIDRIFDRFYRIDDSRNTSENGHGLGLAISKNFVEALGGKIKVDSALNQGTCFTLSFAK